MKRGNETPMGFLLVVMFSLALATLAAVLALDGTVESIRHHKELVVAKSARSQVQRVSAYTCGYLHGQRAMIAQAKLDVQPPPLEGCAQYTDEAITAGFKVAGKNR